MLRIGIIQKSIKSNINPQLLVDKIAIKSSLFTCTRKMGLILIKRATHICFALRVIRVIESRSKFKICFFFSFQIINSNSFIYLKFICIWILIMIADYVLEFRFEFLWPFWLVIRSLHDSFKYQGLVSLFFFYFFYCRSQTKILF